MRTIIDELKHGDISHCIANIASDEGIEPSQLIDNLSNGYTVISQNNRHTVLAPIAIETNPMNFKEIFACQEQDRIQQSYMICVLGVHL